MLCGNHLELGLDNRLNRWGKWWLSKFVKIITPAKRGKKSILRQVKEIATLKFSATKLSLSEYYWHALFDEEVYRDADLATFCGGYMKQWLHERLNSQLWDAVVTDKFIMSMVFDQAGIPHPETYAVACRFPRNCGTVPTFSSTPGLCEFIRHDISYPFFCKPIKGGSAKGANRVESYRPETDMVVLADGDEIDVEQFVKLLHDPTGWGFIFQEAVVGHPQTKRFCGDTVTGCRVIMLVDDDHAYPIWATWKMPAGKNFADNFVHGEVGNILADVDVDTGEAIRVVSGSGLDLLVNPHHPDTGMKIVGEAVPDWSELIVQMKNAALAFPGFRLQHWDVGITSRGPVVYELNTAGDLDLLQLSKGSGFYNNDLKVFMMKLADSGRRTKFVGTPVTPRHE